MTNAIVAVRITARDEATAVFKRVRAGVDELARGVGSDGARITNVFASLRNAAGLLGLTIGIGAFVGAIRESLRALDDLDERAQSLALPADFLSSLSLSAKASGVVDVDRALTKFNATLADARSGNEKAERVVRALGISVDDLRAGTITMEQALRTAANAVAGYADGFEKGNLVQEAFGAKQQKLLTLLNGGEKALTQLSGATKEQIEQAARHAAAIDRLSAAWERLKFTVTGAVLDLIDVVPPSMGQQIEGLNLKLRKLEENLENPRFKKNPELFARIQAEAQKTRGELEGLRSAIDEAAKPKDFRPRAPDVGEKPTKSDAQKDAEGFLLSLRKRAELQQQGEFAALRMEAAERGVAAAAEPIIQKLEKIRDLQEAITLYVKDQERIEQALEQEQSFDRGLRSRLFDLQREGDLIGKSALEQAKLNAQREITAQLDARLRQAGDDGAAIVRAFEAAARAREGIDLALEDNAIRAQRQSLQELLREIEDETALVGASNAQRQRALALRALERSGIDQTSDAYAELIDLINAMERAVDFGDEVRRQQRAFDDLGQSIASDAENAIVKWEGLRNVLAAVEQDILRIVTRNLVTEPLGDALTKLLKSSSGGSVGNIFSDVGGFFARLFGPGPVGAFADGSDYVPRTGLALVHKGERIIPAQQNRTGAIGGAVTQNFYFQGAAATRETANQLAAAAARGLRLANSRSLA